MCRWWIVFMFQLFKVTNNYRLFSIVDTLTKTKYDCIYAYHSPDFFQTTRSSPRSTYIYKPTEQLVPFCLIANRIFVNEKVCRSHNGMCWSFRQLNEEGIRSDDLVRWNAPVNTVDEYEYYLLTNNDELRYSCFCNCTNPIHFGELCQYTFNLMYESFETLLSSHFSNLQQKTVEEAVIMTDTDVTCYKRDLLCNGGCLDWRQICNGIVDCHNGEDEVSCDLLEFNKCRIDEYRCRSGHCIPIMSAFDIVSDCIDGSDEINLDDLIERLVYCYLDIPHMFCDDYNVAWMVYPCGDGDIVENPQFSCANQRHMRTVKHLYATNDITLCWQYMVCAQYWDYLFPSLVNCSELCGENGDCLPMISVVCPDPIVLFPPNPIRLSPSVYFAYQTNKTDNRFLPDYICYTQCDHLFPPSLQINGYSCRSFLDFTSKPFYLPKTFGEIINSMYHLFVGCIHNITRNHSSTIFYCPLTNRALSSHRIKDGYGDCYLSLDETFDGNICALNLTQRFQCWTDPSICIPRLRVRDYIYDCPDRSDEVYPHSCFEGTEQLCNYKRGLDQPASSYYQFKDLCNGEEFIPSLELLLNGTDETDCENIWCQLIPSTLCDGYWDCFDGRDELNCSLISSGFFTEAVIALHDLNGCGALEHFCLPISNMSENPSRLCLAVSRANDGNIDCWGATDERTRFCNYTNELSTEFKLYPCAGTDSVCIDPYKICDGYADCPLQDDEKVCYWLSTTVDKKRFYCHNGTILRRNVRCNDRLDCASGEDEWLCGLRSHILVKSEIEGFYVTRYRFSVYPVVLPNIFMVIAQNFPKVSSVPTVTASDWYCNRGMPIRDIEQRRCLCPSNYMGERCEIQRDRVSIVLQVILPTSLQYVRALKMILYLIHVGSSEILFEEEILHIPYIHSLYKHLSLLPSTHANTSFVRIDAYEVDTQRVITYRTSWKFDLPFPFLPVRRLAVRLTLPDEKNYASRIRSTCHSCLHGECLSHQNSNDVFCRCHNGWVGANCNITFSCASGAQTLSSHRCLCPIDRHGTRCFVPNIISCQCQNGGTCISLDARIGQSACLCTDNFFGKYCECIHANLTIRLNNMHHPEWLPVVLVQFVTVITKDEMYFENVFLFERVSSRNPLIVHHTDYEDLPLIVLCKIFYSSSIHDYTYYLVLYNPLAGSLDEFNPKSVLTQLEHKQKCSHVSEMDIFKSPVNILIYPHIKRIKYYLRACVDDVRRCFHDEVYMCFCPDRTVEIPIPSCIIYDHTRETCKESNYCLNDGLCIENRRKNILQFSCVCSGCHYYGSLCQFSIGQQGLSLDALVGLEMRTGKSLSEQSILIKLCLVIIISMIIIGFVGNLLSTITFSRKKSRQTGCGWYLLLMTISNQCALIIFGLRFVYLLITQMVVWDNRIGSLILCQCLEVALAVLWNLSNWLTACVSIERTLTVVCGASFNKSLSIRCAKWLCVILPFVLTGMAFHEPMTRQLIEDPRLGRYTWCVTKFGSTTIKTVATVFSIFHLLGPFLINLIATGTLIFTISRQKLTVRKEKVPKTFTVVLREQIIYYKHLIISPVLLLILALPRLVISLGSLCIDTSWRNYVFLAGYLISFVPLMTTLFIFILPAPIYQDELKLCLVHCRCFLACRLPKKTDAVKIENISLDIQR